MIFNHNWERKWIKKYKSEFIEIHKVTVLLDKKWLEIVDNIELQSGTSGFSQNLINSMLIYETTLRKIFYILKKMNAPEDFKTAHDIYIQRIGYQIQYFEYFIKFQTALNENDENKALEVSNRLKHMDNMIQTTQDLYLLSLKK